MKVLIYDASEKSLVGLSWKVGALLLAPFFDAVIAATSWKDALDKLAWVFIANKGKPVDEVQLWSHGFLGQPLIAGDSIPLTDERVFKTTKRWWFRCCYTLAGSWGYELADELLEHNVEVVGHTAVIGTWGVHSHLYGVKPGGKPWWPKEAKPKSTPLEPRTISALRLNVPSWAFGSLSELPSKEE